MRHGLSCYLAMWILAAAIAQAQEPVQLAYERDVRPILKSHCFACHGEGDELQGGLDLRSRHLIVAGGESGAAISPGQPDQSLLVERIAAGEMPPGDKKAQPPAGGDHQELDRHGRRHGRPGTREANRPVHCRGTAILVVSTGRGGCLRRRNTPIGCERRSTRSYWPDWSRSSWRSRPTPTGSPLCRATFDLTGLPPTPEEVDQFLADTQADAYERLVDRLLAVSPITASVGPGIGWMSRVMPTRKATSSTTSSAPTPTSIATT